MSSRKSLRLLIFPGFVNDTWSSIEERYIWLDRPLREVGECYWLVPPTGSCFAPVGDPTQRNEEPIYVRKLRENNANLIECDLHKYNFFHNFRMLSKIFDEFGINVVYTHFGALRYHVEAAARLKKVTVIKGEHSLTFHPARRYRFPKRLFWKWVTTYYIPVSHAVAKHLRENHLMKDNGTVVYDGFDLGTYPSPEPERSRAALREELGFGEYARFLVCVAKIDRGKQQHLLVEMLAQIPEPDLHLLLVGQVADQEYFTEISRRVRELAVNERVSFLGYRFDVPRLMDAAELSFLPSKFEGLGNVIIESYLMGTPVVAADLPPIREIIEHEKTGFRVANDDPKAYADFAGRLLEDDCLRQEMARKGGQKVRAMFGRDTFVRESVAAIQQGFSWGS